MKADFDERATINDAKVVSRSVEAMSAGTAPSVTLCIPTFKRPAGLRQLLGTIAFIDYSGPLKIVVIDNDAALQEGIRVVEGLLADGFRFPIQALVEERSGHTYAYNLAFRIAVTERDPSELIAVLDDDEYPAADWLVRMVDALTRFEADIVGGPVVPVFEESSHWLSRTDLFSPLRYRTGPVPAIYGAGNMLIRRDILARYLDEPFSNDLAFTGGSDISFFYRCKSDGVRFAWADDAIVSETIPASRMSVGWLLRRAMRSGVDLGRVARENGRGMPAKLVRLAKGPGLAAVSLARLPVALVLGRAAAVRALMDLARGVGRIASEFDYRYEEYKKRQRS